MKRIYRECPDCAGFGFTPERCFLCNGSGHVHRDEPENTLDDDGQASMDADHGCEDSGNYDCGMNYPR